MRLAPFKVQSLHSRNVPKLRRGCPTNSHTNRLLISITVLDDALTLSPNLYSVANGAVSCSYGGSGRVALDSPPKYVSNQLCWATKYHSILFRVARLVFGPSY